MPEETPIEGRLVLSGEVTIQSAKSIHSKLLEMAGQLVVEIHCDGATETDLSLIQLILAARASARKSRRNVVLARPAAGTLRDALQRGGPRRSRGQTKSGSGFLDANGSNAMTRSSFAWTTRPAFAKWSSLRGAGYQVVRASDGAEGLAKGASRRLISLSRI